MPSVQTQQQRKKTQQQTTICNGFQSRGWTHQIAPVAEDDADGNQDNGHQEDCSHYANGNIIFQFFSEVSPRVPVVIFIARFATSWNEVQNSVSNEELLLRNLSKGEQTEWNSRVG